MSSVPGVQINAPVSAAQQEILTPEALIFLASIHRTFNKTRLSLLEARKTNQLAFNKSVGALAFPKETEGIRNEESWKCAPPGPGLEDRRVEITGPTDRKMVINALNSGAKTFMADFEDSNSPTWSNMVDGQINLRDAVRGTISLESGGKSYSLNKEHAVLIVRPRGWHLPEPRVLIDGEQMSGSMFDFGLYFFHNAKEAVAKGFGPYFYLPKMEHYLEARLWNDIFSFSEAFIKLTPNTIRGTVLIETLPAAFQMEEILWELKEHSSGLNCGRWDYIFSYIKKTQKHSKYVLPDRSEVTMTVPFMDAYVRLLIKTCHKRKVAAMGGMSAQIPIKNDPVANDLAMAKVKADKVREVTAGHDGTWVAHPALVKIALDVFNEKMLGPNQYYIRREDVSVKSTDLTSSSVPGKITLKGVTDNANAALSYCAAWIGGNGCVPINYLMEDAATAEIARCQLWQWAYYGSKMDDGTKLSPSVISKIFEQEAKKVASAQGYTEHNVQIATKYMIDQVSRDSPSEFLTSDLISYLDEGLVRKPSL